MFEDADYISIYTREQAIEDGVLVDISDMASEAGIKYPVALTRGVWELCVNLEQLTEKQRQRQDEAGRLWDVINMYRFAARVAQGDRLLYRLKVVTRKGPRNITLKAIVGPGDTPEPVVTIMLPEED